MGRIQSIQSFSTLDGPGTRCVVFLQGCPVGCIFCHNPDSWNMGGGEEVDVDHLLRRLERFRSFLKSPGLTISGGEPLAQPAFTLDLAIAAKKEGWHVALDTSGFGEEEAFTEIARQVDLVIFSIKHPLEPRKVIRCNPESMSKNWQRLAALSVPVWVRYVLIPGWTDQPQAMEALRCMIKKQPNVEKVEILPFNSLAENKWSKLGWESPLFHGGPTVKVTEEQIRQAEMMVK